MKVYWILVAALSIGPSLARAAEPLATKIDGTTFAGRLTSIDSAGNLLFADSGQRSVPMDQLAWWGTCNEVRKGPVVILADGSLLRGDINACDGKLLDLDSEIAAAARIPRDAVAGVVFQPPASVADRDKLFHRVAQAHEASDLLLLQSGDEITGHMESMDKNKLRITSRLGTLDVATQRALALVTKREVRGPAPVASDRCWIGLIDGSRLLANDFHSQGASLEWKSSFGQSYKADLADVVFLMPLTQRLTYVSDITPSEYHFLPFLDIEWPYYSDRNVTGGMLRAGSRLYLKGLGVHSAARLTYLLDKPWKMFLAEVAIDDSTHGRGSVGFRVFVDGKVKFASGPIRGQMPPVPVRVDLTAARRLDLVVDYGESGDVLDHADWLNARLVAK